PPAAQKAAAQGGDSAGHPGGEPDAAAGHLLPGEPGRARIARDRPEAGAGDVTEVNWLRCRAGAGCSCPAGDANLDADQRPTGEGILEGTGRPAEETMSHTFNQRRRPRSGWSSPTARPGTIEHVVARLSSNPVISACAARLPVPGAVFPRRHPAPRRA